MNLIDSRMAKIFHTSGVLRSRDLVAGGVSRSKISRMAACGQLVRIARGLYAMPNFQSTEHSALATVAQRAPGVIFCLLTALRFHELTTQAPFEVWIAIGNKSHPPRLSYPPLRVVRLSAESLAVGVETHQVDGTTIRVTNVSKTVADCFKFRNKLGLDVALEALREARRMGKASTAALWRFAKIDRVSHVMRPYLESVA